MKFLVGLVLGVAGGWVIRSIAESPHGVGVELMSVALKTKDSIESWASAEYERVADMTAEARSKLAQGSSGAARFSESRKATN